VNKVPIFQAVVVLLKTFNFCKIKNHPSEKPIVLQYFNQNSDYFRGKL
jgi:hypothetical protein